MPKRNRDFEVYLVRVDPDRCERCELCIAYCPVDVFEMAGAAVAVKPQNCLGCRTCEAVCRAKAVTITEI